MRIDVNACGCTQGCTDTLRESAQKVDLWKRILCRTGELNLPQQHASSMLYQLSYMSTSQCKKIWMTMSLWMLCRRPGSSSQNMPQSKKHSRKDTVTRLPAVCLFPSYEPAAYTVEPLIRSETCHIFDSLSRLKDIITDAKYSSWKWTFCETQLIKFCQALQP